MGKKLTWPNIYKRACEKHDNKYSYEEQEYKNGTTKINILCSEHGNFKQSIESHLRGRGCPGCANNVRYTDDTLLKKLKSIYDNKYLYNLEGFKNNESIISINCNLHGWFRMKISNHLHGQECKHCSHMIYSNVNFIEKCNEIHNKYYDYTLVEYKNYKSIIDIICPKHGVFKQNARTHFRGHGCLSCRLSKGELKIESFLNDNNIKFNKQKKFEGCFYKYKLPFDFYLPSYDMCLEYDGQQHFYSINFFGGEKNLEKQRKRDSIKNNFCKNNNIKLFRIKYNDDIDKKLAEIFNEL